MRGHIRKRGSTWSIVFDEAHHPVVDAATAVRRTG